MCSQGKPCGGSHLLSAPALQGQRSTRRDQRWQKELQTLIPGSLLCFCIKCSKHTQRNIFIGTSQGYKTLWLRQMTVQFPVLVLEPILHVKPGMDLQKFGR